MAHLRKVTSVHYVLNGQRVPANMPNASKVTVESEKWYCCWKEGRKSVRVPLCKDKRAAQAMLTDLER